MTVAGTFASGCEFGTALKLGFAALKVFRPFVQYEKSTEQRKRNKAVRMRVRSIQRVMVHIFDVEASTRPGQESVEPIQISQSLDIRTNLQMGTHSSIDWERELLARAVNRLESWLNSKGSLLLLFHLFYSLSLSFSSSLFLPQRPLIHLLCYVSEENCVHYTGQNLPFLSFQHLSVRKARSSVHPLLRAFYFTGRRVPTPIEPAYRNEMVERHIRMAWNVKGRRVTTLL